MKRFTKRIVAMGAAVMMMMSVLSMGASAEEYNYAAEDNVSTFSLQEAVPCSTSGFSLYISNTGVKTSETCDVGNVKKAGTISISVNLTSRTKGTSISFTVLSGGYDVGGNSKNTLGTTSYTYNNSYIDKGDRVLVKVNFNPGSNASGCSAGGSITM